MLRNVRFILVVLLSVLTTFEGAKAEMTWHPYILENTHNGVKDAVVGGIFEGLSYYTSPKKHGICLDKGTSNLQVMTIGRRFMDNHPELWKKPLVEGLVRAWREAYPCG